MTKKVLIQNGRVHQIFGDPVPPLHPDLTAQVIDAPDAVQEGWLYDGASFTPPPPPPPPSDQSQLLNGVLKIAFITVRLTQVLVDKGLIAPGDFDAETRTDFQSLKTIVDRLR